MKDTELIDKLLSNPPRNDWERRVRSYVLDFYQYVFRDPRSIDAFCKVFGAMYEEILKLSLLLQTYGETDDK